MVIKSDKKAQNVHETFKITQADKSNLVPLSTKSLLAINNTHNTHIVIMTIFHNIWKI